MGFIKFFEVPQSSKIRLTKTRKNVGKGNCNSSSIFVHNYCFVNILLNGMV